MQVKPDHLEKYPRNNAVRQLRYLRKRAALSRNPNAKFALTLYI